MIINMLKPIYKPLSAEQKREICRGQDRLINQQARQRFRDEQQKEGIIAQALNCDEGKKVLAQAMVEPIRRSLEYAGISRKLLMVDELPQGALARYERDVAAIAHVTSKGDARYEHYSGRDFSIQKKAIQGFANMIFKTPVPTQDMSFEEVDKELCRIYQDRREIIKSVNSTFSEYSNELTIRIRKLREDKIQKQPRCRKVEGGIEWRLNGKYHNEHGPAIEYTCGDKYWYINGKLHRENGPAVEYPDGGYHYYINDKRHRLDGPACEYAGGNKAWYLNGIEHTEKVHADLVNKARRWEFDRARIEMLYGKGKSKLADAKPTRVTTAEIVDIQEQLRMTASDPNLTIISENTFEYPICLFCGSSDINVDAECICNNCGATRNSKPLAHDKENAWKADLTCKLCGEKTDSNGWCCKIDWSYGSESTLRAMVSRTCNVCENTDIGMRELPLRKHVSIFLCKNCTTEEVAKKQAGAMLKENMITIDQLPDKVKELSQKFSPKLVDVSLVARPTEKLAETKKDIIDGRYETTHFVLGPRKSDEYNEILLKEDIDNAWGLYYSYMKSQCTPPDVTDDRIDGPMYTFPAWDMKQKRYFIWVAQKQRMDKENKVAGWVGEPLKPITTLPQATRPLKPGDQRWLKTHPRFEINRNLPEEDKILVPTFEIASNPQIILSDTKARRFDIIDRISIQAKADIQKEEDSNIFAALIAAKERDREQLCKDDPDWREKEMIASNPQIKISAIKCRFNPKQPNLTEKCNYGGDYFSHSELGKIKLGEENELFGPAAAAAIRGQLLNELHDKGMISSQDHMSEMDFNYDAEVKRLRYEQEVMKNIWTKDIHISSKRETDTTLVTLPSVTLPSVTHKDMYFNNNTSPLTKGSCKESKADALENSSLEPTSRPNCLGRPLLDMKKTPMVRSSINGKPVTNFTPEPGSELSRNAKPDPTKVLVIGARGAKTRYTHPCHSTKFTPSYTP